MLSVGITGGIGSGKSYVAEVLRALSYPVFDCDREAKLLYDNDEVLKQEVVRLFGEELYQTEDGTLDRKRLGTIIFSSEEALKAVNALVHPAVRRAFKHFQERHRALGAKLCFLESAILFNSDLDKMLDKVLLVDADDETRLGRAMQRDNASLEQIKERMACQMSQEEMLNRSNFVINNCDNLAILPQINRFLEQIL